MNIFITGGTGFIGKHLVEKLSRDGHFLYVLARDPEKARDIVRENVVIIEGTIENPDSYRMVFNNSIDAVYHLAAIPGQKWGWNEKDYDRINVRGTQNLLDACGNKIKLFIFCSSINAIKNEAGFARSPYGRSKNKAEKIVLAQKDIKTVIIRPAIVYGPGDERGMMTQLCQMIRKKKFFLIGSGRNILPLVYIDDLVSAFARALNTSETGQMMEVSGPDSLPIKTIADTIAKKLDTPLPLFHIPIWLAEVAAYFSEKIFPLIGKEPFITRHRIDMITKSNPINFEKAQKILGYSPEISFTEGINKTIDWMKQNGNL